MHLLAQTPGMQRYHMAMLAARYSAARYTLDLANHLCVGLDTSAALQQLLVRWAELTVFNCIAHNQLCLEFSVQLNLSPSRVDSSIDCDTVVNRFTPKQSMLMSQPQSNHMQADDS